MANDSALLRMIYNVTLTREPDLYLVHVDQMTIGIIKQNFPNAKIEDDRIFVKSSHPIKHQGVRVATKDGITFETNSQTAKAELLDEIDGTTAKLQSLLNKLRSME